jgi:PAS domain S-box-containing protein
LEAEMNEKNRKKKQPDQEIKMLRLQLSELKDWEKKYKSLVRTSPDAVTLTDLKGRIIEVSPKTLKLHGYRRAEELLGMKAADLIVAKNRKKAASSMRKTLEQGHVGSVEFAMIRKDGSHFIAELDASLIRDAKGKPQAFIATVRDITERKRAENALRQSEERYKALFDRSLYGVFVHDFEGNFLDANRAALKLLGYRKSEITKLDFSSLLDKEQLPLAHKTAAEIRESGFQKKPTQYKLTRKDGTFVWVETEASLIYQAGIPFGILGIARDITERKKAEQALLESEKKYRTIFESLTDVYYRTDKKGIVIEISPSVTKQAGYDPRDVIGNPVTDFYSEPSAREEFDKKLRETGGVNDYELRLLAKDGRLIHVSMSARIVLDENGNHLGVEGVLRDITARKRMEEALRESEEKFRNMVESSLQGIVIMQDERLVYANDALASIIGYDIEELMALPQERVRELVHPADRDMIWRRMADRLAGKKVPSRYEIRVIGKDGSIRWLELVSSVIEFKRRPAVQVAIVDISEQKQAEERIKATLNEKEVMLREIHHRVKNNMQIILSLLRIQARTVRDRKTREMFKQSQNRIRSMALIHEALYKSDDLSNIDFSDYISRMTTHLLSIYRESLGEVSIKQEAEGMFLDINRAIPCGLLISELVSNSLKHAFPEKRKGKISIKMSGHKIHKYRLVVKDNGVGFPEGLNFRETETLGLQLVADLVNQLHGSIDLKKGMGTEFVVNF